MPDFLPLKTDRRSSELVLSVPGVERIARAGPRRQLQTYRKRFAEHAAVFTKWPERLNRAWSVGRSLSSTSSVGLCGRRMGPVRSGLGFHLRKRSGQDQAHCAVALVSRLPRRSPRIELWFHSADKYGPL